MSDDLLKPEEIEALLNAAGGGIRAAEPGRSDSGSSGTLPRADGADARKQPASNKTGNVPSRGAQRSDAGNWQAGDSLTATERLLEHAEAGLAAAVSTGPISSAFGSASPFQFHPFDQKVSGAGDGIGLNALQDVELDLRIELGRTELLIEEVLQLKEGSVVPLNKLAGDPVDILVNGRLIARGEVLVLNDNFCVRVAEILAPTL